MIVEKSFDMNDWVVLSSMVIFWTIFFLLPKMFSRQITSLVMLYGLTIASVFDNSFGAKAFDFYDIMDGPVYTVMDAFVYFLYPPFAYFFCYFYRLFKLRSTGTFFYILFWSLLAVLIEVVFTNTHVFTFKHGYNFYYSFCIYLVTQNSLYFFFQALEKRERYKPLP